jgi:hypothetical protein
MPEGRNYPPVAASTAEQPENRWFAKLVDISRGGLALRMAWPMQAATLLVLDLSDHSSGEPHSFLVRVVHATLEREGRWKIGFAFTHPLSEQELQALLGQSPLLITRSGDCDSFSPIALRPTDFF